MNKKLDNGLRKKAILGIIFGLGALWCFSNEARNGLIIAITIIAYVYLAFITLRVANYAKEWYNKPENKGIRKAVDNQKKQIMEMVNDGYRRENGE